MADQNDLMNEVDAELQRLGVTAQGQETAKSAGPSMEEQLAELRGQLQAQREMFEQANRQRFVGAEGDRPSQSQSQAAQPNALRPWEYSANDWASDAARDPGQAALDAINSKLGLPKGSNPFKLFDLVDQRLKQLGEATIATQRTLSDEMLERHAERFISSHADYEPNAQNAQLLEQYRSNFNLPPTAQGLDLAYAKAREDGHFQPKRRDITQEQNSYGQQFSTQQEQYQQQPPRVPSVRSRPTAAEEDASALIEKLDRMPTSEAMKVWERISRGQ